MLIRRMFVALCSIGLLAVPALALQPPTGQGDFVQVNEVPASEQLRAWPLLVVAYAFVWVAVMVYVWSIRRRLSKVETEMHALERRQSQRSGS